MWWGRRFSLLYIKEKQYFGRRRCFPYDEGYGLAEFKETSKILLLSNYQVLGIRKAVLLLLCQVRSMLYNTRREGTRIMAGGTAISTRPQSGDSSMANTPKYTLRYGV